MTTRKQNEANRRNARSSTGPQTRAGKAASKLNALKHGLRAEEFVVRGEDPADFARLLENLINEFQPLGPLEEQLVERIAASMWRLRRIYRIEAGIFAHESLTIELDRAEDAARDVEKVGLDLIPDPLSEVHITDEERHSRATARVEKTARLLEAESLALSVAFKQDADNTGAFSKSCLAMKPRSSGRFTRLFTSYGVSKRPEEMANSLPLLLLTSPWTALAQRPMVKIRPSQDS